MRRGLSYLEVLIAAGIGLTGLLGVIAMFPVAILNMQKGVVVDTMAAAGPSALEQAKAMGLNNPSTWLLHDAYTGAGIGNWNQAATGYLASPAAGTALPSYDLGPWASICIDPRFASEIAPSQPSATDAPHLFPHYPRSSPNDARMLRVTIKRNVNESASVPMSVHHARLLFKIPDDLIFDRQSDVAVPASQNYVMGNNAEQRRNYMADYEFIVTLTPQLSGVPVDANNESYPNNQTAPITPESLPQGGLASIYKMSVVIFHKRKARLNAIEPTITGEPGDERIVNVPKAPPAAPDWGFVDENNLVINKGISGGEVMIQGASDEDIALHEGDWVMLSGNSFDGAGKFLGPLFQWYKVASLGTTFQSGGFTRRHVTLEGSDWPVNGVPVTSMVIASGAVGVFETTVTRQ